MKVVIMAGGKGTRISSMAPDIPKPMIKINEKPILEYEIEVLKRQGYTDILITVGHLAKEIMDYFGDGNKVSPVTGEVFGVNIEYYIETTPLGTAGALYKFREKLGENFLLLNADFIFDVDINRLVQYHKSKKALATLLVHPNNHPYDSGLIIIDEDSRVIKWINKEDIHPQYYKNLVNAGIHVLSSRILDNILDKEKVDLDRDILKPLVATGKIYAYNSPEYIKDMGTVDRYHMVCRDIENGKVQARNLKNKQKAIFIDRDGTINKYKEFLTNIDDFQLIDGVSEAIKRINDSGYLAIVVTNQPVVARGEISDIELDRIHDKMETVLGLDGAYLDKIYYCPHHPDKGFVGEVAALKVKCNCRKPAPGMLLSAAKDYNIDLSRSWMIGDSYIDILAGKNAGCRTGYIGSLENDYGQDITGESLLSIVLNIFDR